jgi:molybdenum cofactor cytidylyltransferase
MLAAVILAAGESSRMGSPKALLKYQGGPFLEHLIQVTRHPKVGLTRVVLGANAEEICSELRLDPTTVVVNTNWSQGQLSSIHAALRSLPAGVTDGILLCLVDHPLISASLVGELIESFYASGKLIVLPTYSGKRGHPAIFSSTLYAELLAAPLDTGARAVVWAHSTEVLEIPTGEEGVVLNLNDPDALQRALGTS